MPLSKKALISIIIVVGSIITIVAVSAVAYPGAFVQDDATDGEDTEDKDETVPVNDGDSKGSCDKGTSDDESSGISGQGDGAETTIGFPIGAEGLPGISSITLKDQQEKLSFRFTAKYTGEVRSLALGILIPSGNETSFRAGLQEDDGNGRPTGDWIGLSGAGNNKTDRSDFITINLDGPTMLVKGRVYHLVVELTESAVSSSNELKVKIFKVNYPFQPFNEDNTDVLWSDDMMNSLYFSGDEWQERNEWPIFVVRYSDGRTMGQPYSLAAPWVIFGPRLIGQEIVPSTTYVVKEFGFSVAVRGKPVDNLCYEVRDGNNAILASGFFSNSDALTIQTRFVQVKLDSPITLEKDKLYRFVLFSSRAELEEPYHLYGHEFLYDNTISYGGLRNTLTASFDMGETWYKWEDADAIFRLAVN